MRPRAQVWSLAWVLSAALGCSKGVPEERPVLESITALAPEDELPSYPRFDPAEVTPLEVLYFSEYVGKGYARRPIRIGETLHSGRYLGFANGQAQFFGPKHIIVDHLRSRPRNPFMGDIEKSVLLDAETGEVVTEFATYGRPIQWSRGLAIVYREGDDRPYLLDAEQRELVLAIPEGEHDYVLGENYWIELSWTDTKRAWIYARDREGVVHLYAWENRHAPPELPANPFPFFPDGWDALADEVWSRDADECERAILTPPEGWECLEGQRADSLPLSDGWRLDQERNGVFNHRDGRGVDLSSLCPEAQQVETRVLRRDPAQVQIGCEGDKRVWMVWMAPDRVQRLDPELAFRVNQAELRPVFYDELAKFELSERFPENVHAELNFENLTLELVGTDYQCPSFDYYPGSRRFSGMACRRGERIDWFELIDESRQVRSRFQAVAVAVSRTGDALGIVRQGGRDRVVRLSIR